MVESEHRWLIHEDQSLCSLQICQHSCLSALLHISLGNSDCSLFPLLPPKTVEWGFASSFYSACSEHAQQKRAHKIWSHICEPTFNSVSQTSFPGEKREYFKCWIVDFLPVRDTLSQKYEIALSHRRFTPGNGRSRGTCMNTRV